MSTSNPNRKRKSNPQKKSNESNSSLAESICRQAMNHLLKTTFIMTRQVLTKEVVNKNQNLELDGYCDKLKVAFEYQGYPSHRDANHKRFESTVAIDLIKKEACKKLGITLVVIPSLQDSKMWKPSYVINEISKHIKIAFEAENRKIPPLPLTGFEINFNIENENHKMYLKFMSDIAKENEGELLDSNWKGCNALYLFKDKKGIKFTRTYQFIKRYGWKPSNKVKNFERSARIEGEKNLNEMRKIAESNGCILISTNYEKRCRGLLEFLNPRNGIKFKTSLRKVLDRGWPAKHSSPETPGFEVAQERRKARNEARKLATKKVKMQESAPIH